jgi:hypothetical protein
MVVLLFGARNTSTAGISVADSRGNRSDDRCRPGQHLVRIASTMQNAVTFQSGDTVNHVRNGSDQPALGLLEEFSSIAPTNRLDVTKTNGSSTAVATCNSGTTLATAQQSELANRPRPPDSGVRGLVVIGSRSAQRMIEEIRHAELKGLESRMAA